MKNIIRITLAIIATIFVMNAAFSQNDSLVVHVRDIDIVMMKVEGGSFGVGANPRLEIRYRRGVSPETKNMRIGMRLVLDV